MNSIIIASKCVAKVYTLILLLTTHKRGSRMKRILNIVQAISLFSPLEQIETLAVTEFCTEICSLLYALLLKIY